MDRLQVTCSSTASGQDSTVVLALLIMVASFLLAPQLNRLGVGLKGCTNEMPGLLENEVSNAPSPETERHKANCGDTEVEGFNFPKADLEMEKALNIFLATKRSQWEKEVAVARERGTSQMETSTKGDMDKLQSALAAAKTDLAAMKAECASKETQISTLKATADELRQVNEDLRMHENSWQQEREKLLHGHSVTISHHTKELATLRCIQRDIESNLRDSEAKRRSLEDELQLAETRCRLRDIEIQKSSEARNDLQTAYQRLDEKNLMLTDKVQEYNARLNQVLSSAPNAPQFPSVSPPQASSSHVDMWQGQTQSADSSPWMFRPTTLDRYDRRYATLGKCSSPTSEPNQQSTPPSTHPPIHPFLLLKPEGNTASSSQLPVNAPRPLPVPALRVIDRYIDPSPTPSPAPPQYAPRDGPCQYSQPTINSSHSSLLSSLDVDREQSHHGRNEATEVDNLTTLPAPPTLSPPGSPPRYESSPSPSPSPSPAEHGTYGNTVAPLRFKRNFAHLIPRLSPSTRDARHSE